MAIASINPATGKILKTFTPLTRDEIDQKLALAASAFAVHRRTSFADRARKMQRAAEILENEAGIFARTMAQEMGKPITAGIGEARKCATCCRYYAENAARFLADEPIETDAAKSFISYQPLGPVLAVMPWNFPLWQVIRFAAPALMAGNVGLLKHASNVPQCALTLEDLFRRAGFPGGAFQTLLIGADAVAHVLSDPRVRAATLTGSEAAGSSMAAIAGRLLKKTVLELGGSDPFIVMPSAKLDEALSTAAKARTINTGQSCIAAKRFLVHERIYAEFEARFTEQMDALRIGDPLDEETEIGPLATPAVLDSLEDQVCQSLAAGARLVTGGKRLARPGNFYAPTVLADIPREAPVFAEETFGPVAALFRVRDIDEAIALANDTTFGLGASAWTSDAAEQERFAREIEAGQVFLNAMVASDPRVPFGGVKRSGYGRELSREGIREFVNLKTVWLA